MNVDWRRMFWEQAEAAGRCQGVDFVGAGEWTDEEKEAIRGLYAEKECPSPFWEDRK